MNMEIKLHTVSKEHLTTITSNYYAYYGTDIEGLEGTDTYAMIFGSDGTASYWLASSFARTFDAYFNLGIRVVAEAEVQRSYLRIYEGEDRGISKLEATFGIRAVVYLDDTVELVQTGTNTFKIV